MKKKNEETIKHLEILRELKKNKDDLQKIVRDEITNENIEKFNNIIKDIQLIGGDVTYNLIATMSLNEIIILKNKEKKTKKDLKINNKADLKNLKDNELEKKKTLLTSFNKTLTEINNTCEDATKLFNINENNFKKISENINVIIKQYSNTNNKQQKKNQIFLKRNDKITLSIIKQIQGNINNLIEIENSIENNNLKDKDKDEFKNIITKIIKNTETKFLEAINSGLNDNKKIQELKEELDSKYSITGDNIKNKLTDIYKLKIDNDMKKDNVDYNIKFAKIQENIKNLYENYTKNETLKLKDKYLKKLKEQEKEGLEEVRGKAAQTAAAEKAAAEKAAAEKADEKKQAKSEKADKKQKKFELYKRLSDLISDEETTDEQKKKVRQDIANIMYDLLNN